MTPFLKNKLLLLLPFSLAFTLILHSCNNGDSKNTEEENTHTQGLLKIMADDTFKPILWTSAETFSSINPKATLEVEYKAQEVSFVELINGKVDLIIAGRDITKEEERIIRSKNRIPNVNKLASDALVFIVAKSQTETNISEKRINEILLGKEEKTQFICDKSNSGNLIYLKDRFKLPPSMTGIVAAGSDSAVIEYVATHPNAVGIIGMALVSDLEAPKVKARLNRVKLLSIEYKDSLGTAVIGNPTLEEVAIQKYPFIRDIFIINLDGSSRLGTGFANYMVGEKGQRIILKAGLLPAQLPGREILIVK